MTDPRISVFLPVRNGMPWLQDALLSLSCQRVSPYEVTVIDAGSKDGSLDYLRKSATDVRVIAQRSSGLTGAINEGFEASNGDVIIWLNADDIALPGLFDLAFEASTRAGEIVAVTGDYLIIDKKGRILQQKTPRQPTYRSLLRRGILNVFTGATVFSAAVKQCLPLPTGEMPYAMDYELFLRIAEVGLILKRPGFVAAFRRHDESQTSVNAIASLRDSLRVRDTRHLTRIDRLVSTVHLGQMAGHLAKRRLFG